MSSSSSYGWRSSYLAATFHKRNAMMTSHSSDVSSTHNMIDEFNETEPINVNNTHTTLPHDLYPDPAVLLEEQYTPSASEIVTLTEPIAFFLSQCTCYDVLGVSTQVVVLDAQTTLAVAFIAAQEARVQSCVIWDGVARQFIGVLTSTDYLKILLFCEAHPHRGEEVALWTIRHWLSLRNTLSFEESKFARLMEHTTHQTETVRRSNNKKQQDINSDKGNTCNIENDVNTNNKNSIKGKTHQSESDHVNSQHVSSSTEQLGMEEENLEEQQQENELQAKHKLAPPCLIACKTDTSLKDCLLRMKSGEVHSIVAFAEKEAGSLSVVAMLDLERIVDHIGLMFFHVERAGVAMRLRNGRDELQYEPERNAQSKRMKNMNTNKNTRNNDNDMNGYNNDNNDNNNDNNNNDNTNDNNNNNNDNTAFSSTGVNVNVNALGSGHLLNPQRVNAQPLNGNNSNKQTDNNNSNSNNSDDNTNAPHNLNNIIKGNEFMRELIDHDGHGLNEELFELAEGVLPPHVASILSQVEANHGNHGEPKVGPYRSIFDIPFVFVPELGKNRHNAIYVTLDAPLYEALFKMLTYNVECIAVCNEAMNVVDVISQSDLLRMEDQGVYNTTISIRDALMTKMYNEIYVFYEEDSLREIFTHFVRRRVKELFLVDPRNGKLQGQLNVSELVFFLVFGTTSVCSTCPSTVTSNTSSEQITPTTQLL